jgi:4-hydroxyacetophenone monooxygenase
LTDPIPRDTDDLSIAEALEHASLPSLIPALVHITGDTSLLDRYAPRAPGRDIDGTGLSDDEVRALALEILKAIRDGHQAPPAPLSDSTLCRLMTWCAGEEVPPEYLPLVLEESRFRRSRRTPIGVVPRARTRRRRALSGPTPIPSWAA